MVEEVLHKREDPVSSPGWGGSIKLSPGFGCLDACDGRRNS